MDIQFAREPFSVGLAGEVFALMDAHREEVATIYGDRSEVDLERYAELDRAGRIYVFTARDLDADGEMVGYCVLVAAVHPHVAHELTATQTALFLLPEARRGSTGLQFIRFADGALQADGVGMVFRSLTPRRDLRPVYHAAGYEECDIVYARRLRSNGDARTIMSGS